jgi:hypothetical protein
MIRSSLLAAVIALPLTALSSHAQASSHSRGCPLSEHSAADVVAAPVHRTDRLFRDVDQALRRSGDRLFNWGVRQPRSSR